MSATRGIPTKYRGVNYRSRTEARWAVFFDKVGWPAEYEPIDLKGYIPDFIISFPAGPMLVEIKSDSYTQDLETHTTKIEQSGWERDALILGSTPSIISSNYGTVFGHVSDAWTETLDDTTELLIAWGEAHAAQCTFCGALGFDSHVQSYRNRACGHYDGDHYRSDWPTDHLRAMWAEAINTVQWMSRKAAS